HETVDLRRFRARQSAPLDTADVGRVRATFGDLEDLSPAALCVSLHLVFIWRWYRPQLTPGTAAAFGVTPDPPSTQPGPGDFYLVARLKPPLPAGPDYFCRAAMYEWVERARLLARYDRDRKIDLYKTLPRNSNGEIAWGVLDPLGQWPWHAPL